MEAKTTEQIWDADRLDRRQKADFLYNFIVGEVAKRKRLGRRSSYSLNIDAEWGGGKSFFLERFGKQAEAEGHVVASVNAWKDDHAGDPYIAIMAAIDRAFAPHVKKDSSVKTAWKSVKSNGGRIAVKAAGGAIRSLAKKHFDITADDILGEDADQSLVSEAAEAAIKSSIETGAGEIEKLFDRTLEALIGQFQKADKAIQTFREKLAAAVEALDKSGKKAPLFILIDELDRCRPSYAVHLLERIKHLFEVDGVAFVFATNSQQLQHSIAGAYGQGFNGFAYLKRFFDRTYIFGPVSAKRRIEDLCVTIDNRKVRAPDDDMVEFLASGCTAYGLDLRAIEQVLEMIEVTVSAWPHKIPLDLMLLLPLCVAFYRTGELSWAAAQGNLPNAWYIGTIVVMHRDGVQVDRRISINRAFSSAIDRFESMEKIMKNRHSSAEDRTEDYVSGTFSPEWNGVTIARSAPSIQTGLLDLVANAGGLIETTQSQRDS
ncbi:KAP family P-loop NTPase fold protein [Rhizobium ruizarguesonis]|uniref:KAP family P-loop NTPase fold protein n=1 Tax=Rhizobium ruizarguesonis TaxID=2081791 RepID=UPI0013EEC239|nr:P-loop NTPase fold protein [Rhizobium ruizarguesonis]